MGNIIKSKYMILQLEDRNENMLNQFMDHNKEICDENNLRYMRKKKSSYHVPCYWGKIFEMKKLMTENPNTPFFMWLDSDAFFINFDKKRFTTFVNKHLENKSMIITKDMPPWNDGEFNAGSFIVKNDSTGKKILEDWINLYNKNVWHYNGEWTTKAKWAGEEYEQGAFSMHILPKYRNNIQQLDYYFLNNNNPEKNNEAITAHLARNFKHDKNLRDKFFKLKTFPWVFFVLMIVIFFIIYFK